MEDLVVSQHVVNFYNNLILGRDFYDSVPDSHLAGMVVADVERVLNERFDVRKITRRGGLLKALRRDFDRFVNAMRENNERFFASEEEEEVVDEEGEVVEEKRDEKRIRSARPNDEEEEEENDTVMRFDLDETQWFFARLSQTCGGSLDRGISSNLFVYRVLRSAYFEEGNSQRVNKFERFVRPRPCNENDSAILDKFLNDRPVGSVTFCDASFWGNVARNLIVQKGNRRPIVVPKDRLDKMGTLYWLKCQSAGRIVDPFSLSLEFRSSVDPRRWSSAESLLTFAKAEPDHPLSRSLRSVCGKMLACVFDCDESAFSFLPRNDERDFYVKFVRNVRCVDAAVARVESKYEPPKLVDVFQRLLALANADGLWKETPPPASSSSSEKCSVKSFFEMHLQLVAAETEIENLKKILDAPTYPSGTKRTMLGFRRGEAKDSI